MKRFAGKRIFAACRGNAAIEFALVAPLFFMLVFGCIEFARLLWTTMALQQTAISGARCMAIAQGAVQNSACASGTAYSAASTETYIETVGANWGVTLTDANITLNNAATCGGVSGSSQVTLTSTFTTPVPQLVSLAAGGTSLTATACYPNNPY